MLGLERADTADEVRARFRDLVERIPPGDEADAHFARLLAARNTALLCIEDRLAEESDASLQPAADAGERGTLRPEGAYIDDDDERLNAEGLVGRHTENLRRYRMIASVVGGVSLIVSLSLGDVVPLPYWILPRDGLSLTVFAVLTLLAGAWLLILGRMRSDIVREVMHAEDILDSTWRYGELLQILVSVGGLGSVWSRGQLEAAVRAWLRPGRAACGLQFGDDSAETTLKDLAHRVGPTDFAAYLVTKGLQLRALVEYVERNAAGRLIVRYELQHLPHPGPDFDSEDAVE